MWFNLIAIFIFIGVAAYLIFGMNQDTKKILFICKKNETYGFESYTHKSSGLYNSTNFIVDSLNNYKKIQAKIVEVEDNNSIDKEVALFKPDVVVIEALWVVPDKFVILQKLHPTVKWFVHLHSHMPFLSLEGIAMEWLPAYMNLNVGVIANSEPSYEALSCILTTQLVCLPNIYLSQPREMLFLEKDWIDVGCFGAVRPLKNHLIQALAAIKFAKEKNKYLKFHINSSRVETKGEPVLKNLRKLFLTVPNAELVEHPWYEPEDFLDMLQSMDIGLQVSLSETFNVVTADYVTAGLPVVVSKEISWVSQSCWAQDDKVWSISNRMHDVWRNKSLVHTNQKLLEKHSEHAQKLWLAFVMGS